MSYGSKRLGGGGAGQKAGGQKTGVQTEKSPKQ